jgi:Fe-S-cluster containining protein
MRPVRDENEQHRRFDAFGVMAAMCDNIGRTDDTRDLYTLIDAVVADLQVAMPPFACRAGCNACCYTPPMVTSLEWQVLHRHLLTLPVQIQLQIIAAAEALRPMSAHLRDKRRAIMQPGTGPVSSHPLQCPMLVGGNCAVYKARPLICRGHGYFVTTMDGAPKFFGSALAMAHIQETMPRDLVLPRFDPYAERVGALHAGVGTQAYIPEWLWAHIRDGKFLPEANLSPDFDGPPPQQATPVAR